MQIVRTSKQEIHGLSVDQRTKIKDALTFDNPKYKSAKRYSRSKYISTPPYLTYYDEYSVRTPEGDRRKVLSVPIGVDIQSLLGAEIPIKDQRIENKVRYPKFALDLRTGQQLAEDAYLSEQDKEFPKCIVQLPTGKGKSILALHLAYVLQQKTLILVHKDDLVAGWKADIKKCFPTMKSGLIKAQSRTVGEQITIATVQTLNRMSPEEISKYTNQFGFVVQDECHHIGLNIFNILDQFNSKYKIGLSATPKRSDGLNFTFNLFLGGLCYKHIITDDDEDICGVKVEVLDSPCEYKPFYHKGQVFNYYDFSPKDLPDDIQFLSEMDYKTRPRVPFLVIDNEVVTNTKNKIMVCKKIIEHYMAGHSIIALFTQKEHINLYHRYLSRYIPKDQILLYYGDAKEDSATMMEKAEKRECLVTLATYAKATEGTNVKSWEVEFLVSSLNNDKNVEQATGRIRRRKEGKLSPVLVYDIRYSGCYSLQSHYTTRKKVYDNLRYEVKDPQVKNTKRSMFSRGYN